MLRTKKIGLFRGKITTVKNSKYTKFLPNLTLWIFIRIKHHQRMQKIKIMVRIYTTDGQTRIQVRTSQYPPLPKQTAQLQHIYV